MINNTKNVMQIDTGERTQGVALEPRVAPWAIIFRPFRAGKGFRVIVNPGLHPGLLYFALSGLEKDLG